MGCPVKITVSYDKWQQRLKVQNCITDHCHCTNKEILKHYPSERRLSKQQEKDVCDVLALCANDKLTLGMIEKRFGWHVTLRDMQNLKAKIKESNNRGQKDAVNTLSFFGRCFTKEL